MSDVDEMGAGQKQKILSIANRWLREMAGYTIFALSRKKVSKRIIIDTNKESERFEREVSIIMLGDFMVDTERNLIYGHEQFRSVNSKAMGVLKCLIKYQGEIVSKEVLSVESWPEGILYFNEVTTVIIQLRTLLKDSASSPLYIKTIGHKGYRLIMPVEQVSFGVFASHF